MRRLSILATLIVITAGCAPSSPTRPSGDSVPTTAHQDRTVVVLVPTEPQSPSIIDYKASGGGTQRLFNAGLAQTDDRYVDVPYLMEAPPQLNTDTWRVFPDGRMETIYRLRPNITWHDGTPFDAEDFVFASKTLKTPGLGIDLRFDELMQEMVALDSRTLLARWKVSYPRAAWITTGTLTPLPRHILAQPFDQLPMTGPDDFLSHPYWFNDFVGLGPYKLERWDRGVAMEGVAFDGHVLGRPKIDRIRVLFVSDPNTAVAYLLSGEAHVAVDRTVAFEQGMIVKGEWQARNAGAVQTLASQVRIITPQMRADYASPKSLLDLRVRKALAHGVDRQELMEVLLAGESSVANTLIPTTDARYPETDRIISKYPFDPRRAQEYMREAGFTQGSDGFYIGANGESFSLEARGTITGFSERENAILVDGWRRQGIDARSRMVSQNEVRDFEVLHTWSGVQNTGVQAAGAVDGILQRLTEGRIAAASNRWVGTNLSGWANPEFDRLYRVVTGSLDEGETDRSVAQALKVVSDELPVIPMFYDIVMVPVAASVGNVRPNGRTSGQTWNVYEWEWR